MRKKINKPLPPLHAERSLEADEATETVRSESHATGMSRTLARTGRNHIGSSVSQGGLLDNRFELLEILGSGGISTVYKALDRNKSEASKDQYVTIKVLRKQYQVNENLRAASEQASRKYQELDHPNIVKIHSFHRDGATGYTLMEYLSGESLGQMIRSGRANQMPVKQALWIVNEIGSALTYAHKHGVVHGDLKPANVFLTDSGDVKLIDFGIAQALRRSAKDEADAPHFGPDNYSVSTPSYASLELLDLREPDPRDDVYALACIAYELLAGQHPFGRVRATGARDFGLKVRSSGAFTKAQWNSLQKALAFDRDERTPTVTAFLTGINRFASNWIGWVSLAAGVMVFAVAVSFFFGGSYTPVNDRLAESGKATVPTLLGQSDRDQGPQMRVMGELTAEAQLPASGQSTPAQDELTYEADQATNGLMRVTEQETRIQERTPPTQGDGDPLVNVEPEPTIQPAQLDTKASLSVTDEPRSAQPPITADTATAAQAKKLVSVDETFATITEDVPKATADNGLEGSKESYSTDVSDQSPREEAAHTSSELKARDEGSPERHLADLLRLAENQIAAQHLSSPAGDNALETYREVLRLEPGHEGVKQGFLKIQRQYNKWSEAARDRGDWEKAKAYVRKSIAIDPQDSAALLDRLRELELEEASRAEQEAIRQAEKETLIAKAETASARRSPEIARNGAVEHADMEKGAVVSSLSGAEKETHLKKLPPSYSHPAIVINEFMASNDQTIADSQGGYDDWIELYNSGRETIDLSGYYLSDNPDKPKRWRFPDGTKIGAYSYLVVWADRSSSYTDLTSNPPELHTNFDLSRRGEHILLVNSDEKGNSIIDRIKFSRQRKDLSMGRYPDGLGDFGRIQAPTPGWANSIPR